MSRSAASLCPFALETRRLLQRAGLAFEVAPEPEPFDAHTANPFEAAPRLFDHGAPIAHGARVFDAVEAVSSRSLHEALNEAEATEARRWEQFAHTTLHAFVVGARWADTKNWPAFRRARFHRISTFVGAFLLPRLRNAVIKQLEARSPSHQKHADTLASFTALLAELESRAPIRGFWISPSVSIADVALFAQLTSLRNELTPSYATAIAKHRRLCAYLERVDRATTAPDRSTPSATTKQLVSLLVS